MGHHHHRRESNVALVFFINLTFTIIELIGGFLTNSMAVISNAIHDTGDVMALGLSWYFERVAKREGDRTFSFGYKRFSLLAALVNGIILFGGTLMILLHAIPRLFAPEEIHTEGMVIIAIIGITVNGLAAFRLGKGKSMNENILTLHLMEDVFGWAAVLIIATTMTFVDLPILDPLLSLVFAIVIIYNAFGNLKKTLMIFLQSIPHDIDLELIESTVSSLPGVENLHDTHVWSLDGEHHILSTHILVDSRLSIDTVENLKSRVRNKLKEFEIQHATIEIDYRGTKCEWHRLKEGSDV